MVNSSGLLLPGMSLEFPRPLMPTAPLELSLIPPAPPPPAIPGHISVPPPHLRGPLQVRACCFHLLQLQPLSGAQLLTHKAGFLCRLPHSGLW